MGGFISYPDAPSQSPVPAGKQRIHVIGWPMSPHFGRAEQLARKIAAHHPAKFESWFFFSFGPNLRGDAGDGKGGLYALAKSTFNAEDKERLKDHKSVPFVWISGGDGTVKGLGGRDKFCEWIASQPELMADESIKTLATTEPGFGDVLADTTPGTAQPKAEQSC